MLKKRLTGSFTKNKRIEVMDVGRKMRQNPDWSKVYLLKDGLHESPAGIKLIAQIIANEIKSEHNK